MQHTRALLVAVDDLHGTVTIDDKLIGYAAMAYSDPGQVMGDVSETLADLLGERLNWPKSDPREGE